MKPARNFLATIIESKRRRLAGAKAIRSLEGVRAAALRVRASAQAHALKAALARDVHLNVIAEFKRASPSRGDIRREASPAETARAYERGGAAAVSVLTEEDHFRGSLADLLAAREAVRLPVLRKDFVVDEWQVYESAAAGADALLLIVAALGDEALARLRRLAEEELRMDALVEVHTPEELRRAQACGARFVGVNNRDLHSFEVSLETSAEVAALAGADALLVSESGLRTRDDLLRLRALGFSGFLVGEALMRAADPAEAVRKLIRGGRGAAEDGEG